MKRILLLSLLLTTVITLQAQLEEDFSPAPAGWVLAQGASISSVNGNAGIVTPGVGGNNPAVVGTPLVNKTSNTVKVCLDFQVYSSNLNNQVPLPCATFMDVLFVKSSVNSPKDAQDPVNIYARVDNYQIVAGTNCFTFNFPANVVATDFKVFLSFHAGCTQSGVKYVLDNIKISGVDEVCPGVTCPPAALDDFFTRTSNSELSFDAVLYGSNINYPDPLGKVVDLGGTDNDPNDTYTHLQWSLVTPPTDGSVVVNADGTCTITRNSTAVVQLSFVYRLCDDGADNNFSTTGDNSFDEATVTIFFVAAKLPVLLSGFTVSRRDEQVTIKWTTTTESNNSRFELQRSAGGAAWQTIAAIASKATNGNSDVTLHYEFSEANATKQVVAYRLVQVDKDGKKTVYAARLVRGLGAMSKMTMTPNPASSGRVTLIFDDAQPKDIVITDLGGKTVQQWKRYSQSNLPVSGLHAGLYLVQVTTPDTAEKQVQKLIVSH